MAEITSKVKLSYLKNGAWKSFASKIQSSIDGLKIQTSSSAYYLQYRTWNQGKTAFYPYVQSTVDDYAGMTGRPVQLLQIQALKSDGTQLDSGIVVMFRTYTDGKWLPWVSNADPKWMESVQKKYKLGGTLDTSGAYAGLSGKNADGVEIRVFEEGPLGNFEGGEVKAGFSYMADSESNWTEFSSAALAPYMDGIKIQTPANKGYYLTYKTWNEGKDTYYPAVKSTVNDYAGAPGRHIQRLAVSAYKNDGTVLTSGVIVMYRAFVEDRWLPWVSNADPQWMRSIKEKHELDGTLDTSSGYAGISGKNIGGIEIRIFEDDAPNAGSDRFEGDEIPLELSYIANSNTWHSFTKSVKASPMDGIKIQTSASDFYLAYKTWNEGKGNYYPEVKSTENDYAGMAGRPIQRVSISACSADGARLDSGVVVMYRAFVDGRWLPWVSNAGAEHMKNVQSRFNLDGTLDTVSGYAGISGKNIAGLEIRAFKGELDEGIQDLPGTESAPAMSYMYSNIWQSFPGSILHDPIEGVKIQTASSKPYYFTYKTWNEGKTWYYPAVKSTEDDYAGMSGRPIQRLNIQVFRNDGTALESGVVVMYRVYVEGRWLPWVSNATREWMQSVQDKYQLGGALDSTSTYAGIGGKNISGLEIRVYEENQITDTPITPTGKHKIIDVDFITQIDKYPTGCESVTAVMALHHIDFNLSVDNFIDHYLDMQPYPFDPFETFGGDPYSYNGWGCYAPVIKKALDKALAGLPYYAEELSGVSLEKLCTDYIDKNIPVILWATMGTRAARTISWSYNGRRIEWVQPEHCLLLVGYDEKHYIFNDPQKSGPLTYYTRESVETAYKAQFSQAVVILRKKEEPEEPEPSIGNYARPAIPPVGSNTPSILSLLQYIRKLEDAYKEYSESTYMSGVMMPYNPADTVLKVTGFLRNLGYNDLQWSITTGLGPDEGFVSYVEEKYGAVYDTLRPYICSEGNGQTRASVSDGDRGLMDLAHLAATLESYLTNTIIPDHWASWGGDLATGMTDTQINIDQNKDTIYQGKSDWEIANATIGKHGLSCSYTDFCSDFDAYKISKMLQEDSEANSSNRHYLSETIEKYYTKYDDLFTRRFTWIFEELDCQELRDDYMGFAKKVVDEMAKDPDDFALINIFKGRWPKTEIIGYCCASFACYIYTMIH